MKRELSEQEFAAAAQRAIPSPEQIERLLEGNCHHGMAVVLCHRCALERLFEQALVNLAPEVGATEEQARAQAAQFTSETRNPKCSRLKCGKRAEFIGRIRLRLRDAGVADGTYEAEFGEEGPAGGLCAEHRAAFSVERGARDCAAAICAALGTVLPPTAAWDFTVDWQPVRPEIV